MERLVDHDCDPTVVNNQGETALDLACRFGHLEVMRLDEHCLIHQQSDRKTKFHVNCFIEGCSNLVE